MTNDHELSVDRRYKLTDKLGAGGMGVVFLAEDRITKDKIALKQVLKNPADLMFGTKGTYSSAGLSLAKEFQFLASLRHPNIVSCFGL